MYRQINNSRVWLLNNAPFLPRIDKRLLTVFFVLEVTLSAVVQGVVHKILRASVVEVVRGAGTQARGAGKPVTPSWTKGTLPTIPEGSTPTGQPCLTLPST